MIISMATVFFSSMATYGQTVARQTLPNHVPRAIARFHLQPLHDLPESNRLHLAISLPLRNEPGLDQLLQQLYDPASAHYHQYLTPEEFTAQFGPTEQSYNTVIHFLETNGLTVTTTYSNRTLVDVSGDAATVNQAFHVTMRVYKHPTESRTFYAADTDPVIDASIPISHITGLDNLVIPRPLRKVGHASNNPSGGKVAFGAGSGPVGQFLGNDFRAAYAPGVTLDGTGQSVALFELDAFYASDITNYEQVAGLANITVTNIPVNGGVATPGNGDGEVSLDIEMAISIATNLSKVLVYEAPNGNGNSAIDLLQRIANDNLAKQISSSWLIGDSSSFDTYYKQMASQGQSFFQASGDDGAFFSGISEWADDTNITLVGGTTLNTTGPQGAWSSESAWNWYINLPPNTNATGGGTNFNGVLIPGWQQGISMANNQGSTTLRNIPDVALTADNIYVYYNDGNFSPNEFSGGTSAAAPLWAAFTALMNQQAAAVGRPPVGFLNPAIYAIGKGPNYTNDFHDITAGNNTNVFVTGKYFAATGYDLCTGWGTPNGQNLINALVPPDSLSIVPAIGFNAVGKPGGPFTSGSQIVSLANLSASSLVWSLTNSSAWLTVSLTNGTLAGGGATNLTVSLSAAAAGLGAGNYSSALTFSDSSSGISQSLLFTLQVTEPMIVSPAAGYTIAGPVNGPFSATSEIFLLTNVAPASLNWQATTASPWLSVSPASGSLAGDGTATVTASLNAAAFNLAAGIYTGQISVTDENSGLAQNAPVTLSVGQSIVFNGNFGTGNLTDWTLTGSGADNFVSTGVTAITPPVGDSYEMLLGTPNTFAFLQQTLPTIAGQRYLLSFLWMNPGSNNHNRFEVNWNTNAATTNTIFNQSNVGIISSWTPLTFVLTATGPSTTLQFAAFNRNYYFGLDDISVWPIPVPTVTSALKTGNGTFSMTWNTVSNVSYVMQYSTNLLSTNWFILGTNTATGSTLTVTNSTSAQSYLFYRIRELP